MKMKTLSRSFRRDLVTYGMVVVMFLAIQLLSGMGMLTNSLSGQLVPICAYIIMAISLNLTVGILGSESKAGALMDLLADFGILEVVRTGTIAIERGRNTIYDNNKEKGEFDYGKNVL